MNKGYDFNGVVDTGRFKPQRDDVIITGNTIPMVESVLLWLNQNGIQCAVYFNPYPHGANNRELVGIWKAEMINKLELEYFYEDDPLQYQIIGKACNRCQVIKV